MSLSDIFFHGFGLGMQADLVANTAKFREFLKEYAVPGFEPFGKSEQARAILNDPQRDVFSLLTLKGNDRWDYEPVGHNFKRDMAFNAISALDDLSRGEVGHALKCVILTGYRADDAVIANGYVHYSDDDSRLHTDTAVKAAVEALYTHFSGEHPKVPA